MIQADAGRVKRAGIRPAGEKFGNPVPYFRPIRNGKGIEHWLKWSWRRCAQRGVGNVVYGSFLWQRQPQPLIGDKKECFVLAIVDARNLYRATDCAAKIILPQSELWDAQVVVKPVVGIRHAVSEVIVCRSVPLIGPRFRFKGKLSARVSAVRRRVRR